MRIEKGVAVDRQQPLVLKEQKVEVVTANKSVPIHVQTPVISKVIEQVPVEFNTEKILEVSTYRDLLVDRVVEQCKEVPVHIEKIC